MAIWWQTITNILIGVVSAIVVLVCQFIWRWRGNRKNFKPLSGDYEECSMPAKRPTGLVITLRHVRNNVVRSEAKSGDGIRLWTGTIVMDNTVPYMGNGVYQHVNKFDCGIHSIQRSTEADPHIMVLGRNTSHPNGVERFNTLWRRL